MPSFNLHILEEALKKASMLRVQLSLKPAGAGGLVYPPTYDQGKHIYRQAWIDGEIHKIVVMDSPQSQSNRVEEALLQAHKRGDIQYPDITISVDSPSGREEYSVLQLSHRVYDAVLLLSKDSKGRHFQKTEIGKAVSQSRIKKATGLYAHAPITLVLGGWDSHSGGGPLAAKIPRTLTSEIIGVDALKAERGAVKFDPMDIRKAAGPVYQQKSSERRFELEAKQKNEKKKNPADFGLGNVPAFEERGASIKYALQNSLISLSAIRNLCFETNDGKFSDERNHAGRVAVTALGLYGLFSQMDAGYFLRSGCDLIPTLEPKLEVIGRTLQDVQSYELNADNALDLLKKSLSQAEMNGLAWRDETLDLAAGDRLATLIERSRNIGMAEED